MKINDWDIKNARSYQLRSNIENHSVSNDSEWVRGSPIPVLFANTVGFQTLKIVLAVKGNGREEIRKNCSEILSRLIAPAQLILDNRRYRFYGILKKSSVNEITYDKWHDLTLELNGYEYDAQADGTPFSESASGVRETIITNPGNIVTPAIVEITPRIGVAKLIVSGVSRNPNTGEDLPVTIRNLTTGKTIVLDGETGLMAEDGDLKAEDIDIWELPSLLPGKNTVTMDSDRMNITVKYYPRFM